MRRLLHASLGLAIALTPVLVHAGENDDRAKLQGVWNLTSLVEKGKAQPQKDVRTLKLRIMGDKYIYEFDGKDEKFTATFKIDAKAKPKAIDITFEDGPLKGKTMTSIYAIDGDELRICGGRDKRPTEFSSTSGDGEIVFTFNRAKK